MNKAIKVKINNKVNETTKKKMTLINEVILPAMDISNKRYITKTLLKLSHRDLTNIVMEILNNGNKMKVRGK